MAIKSNVIQYNEYYPFGLQTSNSWTRENSSNNFLYNEGSELNSTTGFYDLPFRNYDAMLGRFFQIDPLAHLDHSTSPFAYAGNNPVMMNDPSGLLTKAEFIDKINDLWYSPFGGSWSCDAKGGGGDGTTTFFNSDLDAFYAGAGNLDASGLWGSGGAASSFEAAAQAFANGTGGSVPLQPVVITTNGYGNYSGEPYNSPNWLQKRFDASYLTQSDASSWWDLGDEFLNSDFWNSPLMRLYIPDIITIDVSAGATFFAVGQTKSLTLNLFLRGKDFGFHPTVTNTGPYRFGFEFDGGVNAGFLYFNGDPRKLELSTILGTTHLVSAGFIYGGNIVVGTDGNGHVLTVGMSAGIGETAGFSYGRGETFKY